DHSLTVASDALEKAPPLSRVLVGNGISARDYLLTIGSIMYAGTFSEVPGAPEIDADASGVVRSNVEFWRSLPSELQSLAQRWKERRQAAERDGDAAMTR